MVKLNEALLVGGSLLVALVLSKGGDFIKNFSMPQNSTNGLAGPIAEPSSTTIYLIGKYWLNRTNEILSSARKALRSGRLGGHRTL